MSRNSDPADALQQGLRELRNAMEDATERFNRDVRSVLERGGFDKGIGDRVPDPMGVAEHVEQVALRLRAESASAVHDVADAVAGLMDGVSSMVRDTVPGAGAILDSAEQSMRQVVDSLAPVTEPDTEPEVETVVSAAAEKKSSAKKAGAKKTATKKSSAKKAGAKKKSTPKKSAGGS